jgi:hypothetical protein
MRLEPQTLTSLSTDEELDLKPVASGISVATASSSGLRAGHSKTIPGNLVLNGGHNQKTGGSCPASPGGQYLRHGPVKLPVKVTNITTAHQVSDTLYQSSKVLFVLII